MIIVNMIFQAVLRFFLNTIRIVYYRTEYVYCPRLFYIFHQVFYHIQIIFILILLLNKQTISTDDQIVFVTK